MKRISAYLTNIAKYGNPNDDGVPEWKPFIDDNSAVMYFSQTPHIGPVPSANSLKVLGSYFKWRRTP